MTAIRFLAKSLICLALCGSASNAYAQASTGAWDKVPLTELKAGEEPLCKRANTM
jgi:hypothetical protein